MKRLFLLFLAITSTVLIANAQNPKTALVSSLNDMGLHLKTSDEIITSGIFQGQFIQTGSKVEVLLIAKSPFATDSVSSNVRLGYYSSSHPDRLHSLFVSGLEANGKYSLSGLPADPRGPYRFSTPQGTFGFFAQSAEYNPNFSVRGETVFSQNQRNKGISRFKANYSKVLLFPYKTALGLKSDWYVLCWELSSDNDYLDIVTVLRGVKNIQPPPKPKSKKTNRRKPFNPLVAFLDGINKKTFFR